LTLALELPKYTDLERSSDGSEGKRPTPGTIGASAAARELRDPWKTLERRRSFRRRSR
jgi:hypothetical protein